MVVRCDPAHPRAEVREIALQGDERDVRSLQHRRILSGRKINLVALINLSAIGELTDLLFLMSSTITDATTIDSSTNKDRRDFLAVATYAAGAIGLAAASIPFVSQMTPNASVIAAAGPIEVDLSPIEN